MLALCLLESSFLGQIQCLKRSLGSSLPRRRRQQRELVQFLEAQLLRQSLGLNLYPIILQAALSAILALHSGHRIFAHLMLILIKHLNHRCFFAFPLLFFVFRVRGARLISLCLVLAS